MKAVSLRPEWAMPVMLGLKTVECRTWRTEHRGDLLICSSARPCPGAVAGKALCVVTLDDIEPFEARHLWDAYMDDCPRGAWAWKLSGLRWVEPFDVTGRPCSHGQRPPRGQEGSCPGDGRCRHLAAARPAAAAPEVPHAPLYALAPGHDVSRGLKGRMGRYPPPAFGGRPFRWPCSRSWQVSSYFSFAIRSI